MSDFYSKSIEVTLQELQTNIEKGLDTQTAEKRLQEYGENKLEGKPGKTLFQMFLDQFKDFLVLILIVAAIVSIVLGEYLDGSIIIAIVILNSVLGVWQENKANNALKALKELSSPHAKVIRNGDLDHIASNLVTIGDIIVLETGDYIPADLRIVESINLKIDEAALTGESVPAEQDARVVLSEDSVLGDRINCAYMGTVITNGRGKGVVTDVGMNTQMGNIAAMLDEGGDETTPLQKKLDSLGKLLGIVCLAVCAAIFALGFLRGIEPFEMFMTAVSLAVAAIPEGLTVVVTVVLAMGMQKMVKSNAIVKRLSAVETLGSTTVICSDKTGTLTQNKMTVTRLYDGFEHYDVSGTGYSPEGEIIPVDGTKDMDLTHMFLSAVLCNDAVFVKEEKKMLGDPTEGSLLVAGVKHGIDLKEVAKSHERLQELPFDSDRKLMSTFHKDDDGIIMYTKGAPDEILRRSTKIFKNGESDITEEDKARISEANEQFAGDALRVIGVAYKKLKTYEGVTIENGEYELVFCGLFGMIDPPRDEAKDAVAVCKKAGINVKMITGDHKITATAIAAQLGIVDEENKRAVSGLELNELSDEGLREIVKSVNVYARVSPEHKVKLVEAIKQNGNIVAMTGDGVNDAPSLKRADIGVAMAITGTDVSKEAADMILTDDNFASIVRAVEEGRTIYNNIRKVVGYLLSCNIGEILIIFIAMLIGLPVPLAATQLLSINLITDAFPAFALGMEQKEDGIMDLPPRDPKESIVNRPMAIAISIQSVVLALGALGSFLYGYYHVADHLTEATTMCFVTLVLGELLRAYSSRSEYTPIVKMKIFQNSFLNKCTLFSLVFLFSAVYIDFLQPVFKTAPLQFDELAIAVVFAILPIIGGEIAKVFAKKAALSSQAAR